MVVDQSSITRKPTEQILGAEELFFSTTDERGIIQQGNSVFARFSEYTLEEMVGAPHNLVRHPQMPAGVFRLMWERLQSGHIVGVYVCNRTRSGDHYWVYALISPLREGYVSVRTAPRSPDFAVAREIYKEATVAELGATNVGLSRRDVAEVGHAVILESLSKRGFASYEEFMHHCMPGEISERSHLASTRHQRSTATGEIAQVLEGTRGVEGQLSDLVTRLTTFQGLGDRLAEASGRVLEMVRRLEGSVLAAQEASELVARTVPVLGNVARVMAQPMTSAVTELEQFPEAFTQLRRDIARLQFAIGVAALSNNMAAAFAAEVHDGRAPDESLSAVPVLSDTAEGCVREMAGQVQRINADLRQLATRVTQAITLLDDFRRFIGQWRQLVHRKANVALGTQARQIDEEISASGEWTEHLRVLGREVAAAIVPFDEARLLQHLETLRQVSVA